jgi:Ca-activated chloride channel family protein
VNFQGFGAYDVEPLAVPDVLADRPVIVFGKWRGARNGKITLSGISGNGSYREALDVGTIKPMKSNSALRYLWARHRIALLSDSNKLRPKDQRTREVTDLGLAYNLLTAYTSFLAVDTEVRNQGGEQTTIKQPLPLPQGVSDYAVGSAKMSLAPSALLARKEAAPAPLEERAGQREMQDLEKDKRVASIGEVKISGGLTQEAVLQALKKHLPEIRKCASGAGLGRSFVLELTIRPDGRVKSVKIAGGVLKDPSAERCLLEQAKRWKLPSSRDGREVRVTLTLLPKA